MNFFQNIIDGAKDKIEAAKEKKEFLAMVEEQAKPKRREGYFKQAIKDSMAEGAAIARAEHEKRMNKTKPKAPQDFGIGPTKTNSKPQKDQWAYLDNLGLNETKSKGDKK